MSDKKLWDALWARGEHLEWDPLSQEIYDTLMREWGGVTGKRVLEAGAGSGRISLRLAAAGAAVVLVDFSAEALFLARKNFQGRNLEAEYLLADITELPLPDHYVDFAWNAGVLEHLDYRGQVQALKEMKRVTRAGGLVVSFNPNARCLPYRVGKWAAECTGAWPYGAENPVASLAPVCQEAGLTLKKEYTIGLLAGLAFLDYVPNGRLVRAAAEAFLGQLPVEERGLFPGYLLVSVMSSEG